MVALLRCRELRDAHVVGAARDVTRLRKLGREHREVAGRRADHGGRSGGIAQRDLEPEPVVLAGRGRYELLRRGSERHVIRNGQDAGACADALRLRGGRLITSLAGDALRNEVFPRLRAEHERATAALCRLTGQQDLLDHQPWLQRSIRMRNPYIDPMNYAQVALLRRLRAQSEGQETDALREAVLLSVNGIAAGLRNTG